MQLLAYFLALVIIGDFGAYFIGLAVEYKFGGYTSLIVFLTLYFLILWISWLLPVRLSESKKVATA